MASCWKSFSPKKARQGPASEISLVTTVATPAKWPGRDWPSRRAASEPGSTTVAGAPPGYISLAEGAKTRSTPAASAVARSRSRSDGYWVRSSPAANWSGFTKMVAATTSHVDTAALNSDRCPSCRAPIVGTSPSRLPGERAEEVALRNSSREVTTSTNRSRPHRRSRSARPVMRSSPGAGQGRPRRRTRRALPGRSPGGAGRSC